MAGSLEEEEMTDNGKMKTELREKVLHKFENWLDKVLEEEECPVNIPADFLDKFQDDSDQIMEEGNDLYSIWSALTVLSHETKLQGRAFKQLNETILSQEKKRKQEAQKLANDNILAFLLDLRDRLTRGYDISEENLAKYRSRKRANWFSKLFIKDESSELLRAIESMEQGYHLTLLRLNDKLKQLGVQETLCTGQLYNPQTMKAIEIENRTDVKDGLVLEVYRTGYSQNGRITRSAEVKVARDKSGEKNE
ncbi:nucleotide exchange factor GrpE [bacterium]|nr:nucleotide exchange factor GrpE [bacterium]